MAGMTMDPQKCMDSVMSLIAVEGPYYLGVEGALTSYTSFRRAQNATSTVIKINHYNGLGKSLTMVGIGVCGYFFAKAMRFSTTPHGLLRDVWNDCNIGGGLKRKLQQFKAKASEVVGKVLPAPIPTPIPIDSKYSAIDLPTELGHCSTSLPGAALTRSGLGLVDQAMWGIAGGAVLIYGGIALAPFVAPAVPASAPTFAGAVAL